MNIEKIKEEKYLQKKFKNDGSSKQERIEF